MTIEERSTSTTTDTLMSKGLETADMLIAEAMEYAGVNQKTAPKKYEAVERGVRYAVFTSLGLTGIVGTISEEFANGDRTLRNTIFEIKDMAAFQDDLPVQTDREDKN